jgi:hypothetical protein
MQFGGGIVVNFIGRVVGEQIPDNVICDPKVAQQHIARGNLQDLHG